VSKQINKVTFASLVIALGIIYGDIGTSPLYVLNAIINKRIIEEKLILGSLSCIIWTLTLQTTIKYVWLTLKADNNGEGGIFSLYALVRRQRKWLVLPAMIGGAALLADGMITPPISVTSAIEGLRQMPAFRYIEQSTIVYIVIGILVILFFLQQFGTISIGKLFGPIMFIWFSMLALTEIVKHQTGLHIDPGNTDIALSAMAQIGIKGLGPGGTKEYGAQYPEALGISRQQFDGIMRAQGAENA
jgi:KUP system potassium uptake protein